MGVEDAKQALGLPEGSVRALLAFSLVLIFVCLAAFLFGEVNKNNQPVEGKSLTPVTEAQLADLKTNFVVASELAKDQTTGKVRYEQVAASDPKAPPVDDLKHPLYTVTYYPKVNKDAEDFAKQIFTTLATVFVSVVSFYFGSSVTTSRSKPLVMQPKRRSMTPSKTCRTSNRRWKPRRRPSTTPIRMRPSRMRDNAVPEYDG